MSPIHLDFNNGVDAVTVEEVEKIRSRRAPVAPLCGCKTIPAKIEYIREVLHAAILSK